MPDIRAKVHGLGEIGSGLIKPAAAVKHKGNLGALGERVPSHLRLERAGEGGVEDTQRGEAVALEVEAEGLEDQRRGVTRVERDGQVGLGDGRADEQARGLRHAVCARARTWAPCAKWQRDWAAVLVGVQC
jgi:hypothetical protein